MLRQQDDYVELRTKNSGLRALISGAEGGRLVSLVYDGVDIIKFSSPEDYANNFASAVLFPFANRIKGGTYQFEGVNHSLKSNEYGRDNAIHGLVYDKKFDFDDINNSCNSSSVKLSYASDGNLDGFPFRFIVSLSYTLTNNELSFNFKVRNNDKNAFPFTLGWHPYFYSKDLKNSFIDFSSTRKIISDSSQITKGLIPNNSNMPVRINSQNYDDAFELTSNEITFLTPDYKMTLASSFQQNYLQLFTPTDGSQLAIEPMTGVSDSFNNKIGLQILKPNEEFEIKWSIKLELL